MSDGLLATFYLIPGVTGYKVMVCSTRLEGLRAIDTGDKLYSSGASFKSSVVLCDLVVYCPKYMATI